MNQFKLIWAYHISDKMTDIKAKKGEQSSSQTISKSDSKTTPNMKEGLFSDLLMPRGLGKIDENTGLSPSLVKSAITIGTVLICNPVRHSWGRWGQPIRTAGFPRTWGHRFLRGSHIEEKRKGSDQSLRNKVVKDSSRDLTEVFQDSL